MGRSPRPTTLPTFATGPVAGPSKITDLFAGVRNNHLLGLIWFDQAQHHGIFHQDWRLEDSPAALAAFRKAEDARPTCESPSGPAACR